MYIILCKKKKMLLVQLKKSKKHLHKIFYRTKHMIVKDLQCFLLQHCVSGCWNVYEITIVPTKNWVLDDRIKLYQIGSNHLVSKPKTEKNSTMASDSGNHAWWKTFFSSS